MLSFFSDLHCPILPLTADFRVTTLERGLCTAVMKVMLSIFIFYNEEYFDTLFIAVYSILNYLAETYPRSKRAHIIHSIVFTRGHYSHLARQ